MLKKIKNQLERDLSGFLSSLDKQYALKQTCPLLFKSIAEFVLRKGKRIRPILFIIGYRGFSRKNPKGLYASALSLELLHDFMLVHDDIIDKSDLRRGRPSLHQLLNLYLEKRGNPKISGEDLAIVSGDVMYALGLKSFLSVKENLANKERALKKLIDAALYTGSGEFLELISGMEDIARIPKETIYKIYDLKTAYYSFACPLAMGALLAGTSQTEANKLITYGLCLGRAFQIKDDILGIFGQEKDTGKDSLSDLKEAKKTILIWHAFRNSSPKNKKLIRKILSQDKIIKDELFRMRRIMKEAGSLEYAKKEILSLMQTAQKLIVSSKIKKTYRDFLYNYSREILIPDK